MGMSLNRERPVTLFPHRFTHKTKDLSGINFKTHIFNSPDHTLFCEEMDGEVANPQKRIFHKKLNAKRKINIVKCKMTLS
jgi:hypothetical protein